LLLSREVLLDGALAAPVQRLLAQPCRPALPPDGVATAAACLYRYLNR